MRIENRLENLERSPKRNRSLAVAIDRALSTIAAIKQQRLTQSPAEIEQQRRQALERAGFSADDTPTVSQMLARIGNSKGQG